MAVKKIWVRATGNPVPRPWPDTKNKPPITGPVQVVDTVHIRRYINIDKSLVICPPPKPATKPKENKKNTEAKKTASKQK